MSVEELLLPRFKVIASYPDSKTAVGEIFTLKFRPHNGNVYGIEISGTAGIWDEAYFERYPHIFRKLEWHEERADEDMPQYVKHPKIGVMKVADKKHDYREWHVDGEIEHRFAKKGWGIPATEEEYLKQQS